MKISNKDLPPSLLFVISLLGLIVLYTLFYHAIKIDQTPLSLATLIEKNNVDELLWRMLWGLSALLLVMMIWINILISSQIIFNSNHRKISTIIYASIIVICLFSLSLYKYDHGGKASSLVLDAYREEMVMVIDEKMMVIDVINIVNCLSSMARIAIIFIAGAVLSILIKGGCSKEKDVIVKYRQYKTSLSFSALLLVIGVFQTYFLYRIAVTKIYALNNNGLRIANSLTIAGGVSYVFMLIILYLPVAIFLRDYADKVATDSIKEPTRENKINWLKERGIYNSLYKVISEFCIGVSPAIVSLILKII